MERVTNLWQLLQERRDRCALMRTCGVAESELTDGSDFDKFWAYATCMPLLRGHPILKEDADLIRELLGVSVPICPQAAPALWHAAAYRLTGMGEVPSVPEKCEIAFAEPALQAVRSIDLGQAVYAMPTPALLMQLIDPEVRAIRVRVQIERFVKPNPYAAKQLIQKPSDARTADERDLLSAQTLRVLGKLCTERDEENCPVLYVESDFAATDAWRALLAYLQQSGCLAQMVLVASNADALRAAASLAGCLPNPTDAPALRVGIANMALRDLYQTLLPVGMLPTLW